LDELPNRRVNPIPIIVGHPKLRVHERATRIADLYGDRFTIDELDPHVTPGRGGRRRKERHCAGDHRLRNYRLLEFSEPPLGGLGGSPSAAANRPERR
jgi:hypothetical protein